MADKSDGSVVLAQLQIAFLWECNNYEFMWSAVLLFSNSCCRLWSGCQSMVSVDSQVLLGPRQSHSVKV